MPDFSIMVFPSKTLAESVTSDLDVAVSRATRVSGIVSWEQYAIRRHAEYDSCSAERRSGIDAESTQI
jgi:hypothetical protein